MKNSFKIAFLALAIATSFAACKGSGESSADSTVVDSTVVDSTVVDTTVVDTAAVDTAAKM